MVKTSERESGGTSNTPAQNTDRTGKLRALIDWVGFTFTDLATIGLNEVLTMFSDTVKIPFSAWKTGRKNYEGYAESLTFENITIYYEGASDQGIHVDITGQGCRYLEIQFKKLEIQDLSPQPMFWYDFLLYVKKMGGKYTRIDAAIDDFSEYFTVPYLFQKLLLGEVRSKFKSWTPDGYFDMNGQAKQGMSLYFGSKTSRLQAIIYEKGKQLELDDEQKWVRTELRFKHERAVEFVDTLLFQNHIERQVDFGVMVAGILKEYITFLEDRSFQTDSNKSRWKVAPFWNQFLEGIEPLRLTTALPDRNVLRIANWYKQQVSKSYVMMHLSFQGIRDEWEDEMIKAGIKKLTQRDLEIVDEYRRLYSHEDILKLDNTIPMKKKKATDGNISDIYEKDY